MGLLIEKSTSACTLSAGTWSGATSSVVQMTPDLDNTTNDGIEAVPENFPELELASGLWACVPAPSRPAFWTGFQRAIETVVERAIEPSEPEVPIGEFIATFTLTAGFMSMAGDDVYGFVDSFLGDVSTDYLVFDDVAGILYSLAWGDGALRIMLDDIASGTDIGITIDGTSYAVEWTSGEYGLEGYLEIAESPFVDGVTYTITISMNDPVAL